MPKGDDPLASSQISTIQRWITEGARFDGKDARASIRTAAGPRLHPAAPVAYRAAHPVLALTLFPFAGEELIAVGGYNEVTVWNARTGALVRRIGGLPQRVQSIKCSPDGTRLLVAGVYACGEYGEEPDIVDLHSGSKPNFWTYTVTLPFPPFTTKQEPE